MPVLNRVPKPEKRKGGILGVQVRVPPELQQIVGQRVIRRSTGTRDEKEYYRRAPRHCLEIEAVLNTAREQIAPPPRWVLVRPQVKNSVIMVPSRFGTKAALIERGGIGHWVEVAADDNPTWEDLDPPPALAVIDVTPVRVVVTLDQAIADWKKKHGPFRDAQAEKKAEQAKRRAAEALFSFAGTRDMAAITTATAQAWLDGLHDPRQAHDFVCEVKTLYKRLDKANRLPAGNPFANIELPPKPKHRGRDQFSAGRATMILASAAASPDPLIKWGPTIMAHTGMIITEFVYAPASEIKKLHGVWVWHVGEKRVLKTSNRPRVIPLHPDLIAAGFLDFVQSRGDGLLFDADNTQASAALMAHLRGLGIEGTHQVNYSWRHGFISRLVDNGVDPTLRRYLDGHGLGGIDEKHYIHHQMTKMVEAIRSVQPTVPYDV